MGCLLSYHEIFQASLFVFSDWYIYYNREPECDIILARDYASELKEDGRSIIYGIYFDLDSYVMKPASEESLQDILESLSRAQLPTIIIEGHTDSSGDENYNKSLSLKRAQSIVQWLVDHGLDEHVLKAVGRGEELPVADNTTLQGRALNRRVEMFLAK